MLVLLKSEEKVSCPDRIRYAFDEMSVGDNLHILDHKKAESARISAIQFSKRNQLGWRFSIRKMDGGWRLFRIE
jgi:hypothetical protein